MACNPEPLFTKRTDVLPQDIVKILSRKIQIQTFQIAVKFDRDLGSSAAEMPVKFQRDTVNIASNIENLRDLVVRRLTT